MYKKYKNKYEVKAKTAVNFTNTLFEVTIIFKGTFYKSKSHQIHLLTPKYWDFESFFSICKHQMSSPAQVPGLQNITNPIKHSQ